MSEMPEIPNLSAINESNAGEIAQNLETAREELPECGALCISLAYCYFRLRETQKSARCLHRALYTLKEDRNPNLWFVIGLVYKRQKNHKYVELAFLAVIRLDPNYEYRLKIYFELGKSLKVNNKKDQSIKFFKKALETPSQSSKMKILCYLGVIYDSMQLPTKALNKFLAAKSTESCLLSTGCLAWYYLKTGNFLQSISTVLEHSTAPCFKLIWIAALGYLGAEKYNEANSLLHLLVNQIPNDDLVWSALGNLYAKLGQFNEALQCYNRSNTINNQRPEVWFNISLVCQIANGSSTDTTAALLMPQVNVIEWLGVTQNIAFPHINNWVNHMRSQIAEAQALQVLSEMSEHKRQTE